MPSDITWYLTLDRQRLQRASTVADILDQLQYDVDFISQGAPLAPVDLVSNVTDQRIDVFFGVRHAHKPKTTLQPGWRRLAAVRQRSRKGSECTCSHARPNREHVKYMSESTSWPVQCQAFELRDCIAWLVCQTLEGLRIVPHDFRFGSDLGAAENSCQREIELSLRSCGPDLVQYLLKALYYVAFAVRLLAPDELLDVLTATFDNTSIGGEWPGRAPATCQDLISICAGVLTVRSDGYVDFRDCSMRTFLIATQFWGEERGDESMARMCLRYLKEAAEWCIFRPWSRLWRRTSRPFFGYASAHWHRHQRKAEGAANDLAAQLHQKIEADVVSCFEQDGYLQLELRKLSLRLGRDLCRYYGLEFLLQIYIQMGAEDGATSVVTSPFPSPVDCDLLPAQMPRGVSALSGRKTSMRILDNTPAADRASIDTCIGDGSSTGSLTDCESNLEESWASLAHDEHPDQWVSGFDDLRLDDTVTLHETICKGGDGDWHMVDRKEGYGS